MFNIFIFLSKIPIIVGVIVLLYLLFKFCKKFYEEVLVFRDKSFFGAAVDFFDPHRQSFLFIKLNFFSAAILIALIALLSWHYVNPAVVNGYHQSNLFNNVFTQFPQYLIHEFGHRFWCPFRAEWVCYASGNGSEILLPVVLYIVLLRFEGGGYFLPFMLIWLGVAFYDAGSYASDARASALHLTSSDMVSNFKPGVMKGDWHYILQPLGLLEYDIIIGNIFIVLACFCLVIGSYSLYYYLFKYNHKSLI
ncbi:MAG: hypothetical protein LBG46_00975 [Elusimicrobiota bacterium]|jgi:hypothetical protein|nr:hypothetical protein [Elusimicrobiota bacterium]